MSRVLFQKPGWNFPKTLGGVFCIPPLPPSRRSKNIYIRKKLATRPSKYKWDDIPSNQECSEKKQTSRQNMNAVFSSHFPSLKGNEICAMPRRVQGRIQEGGPWILGILKERAMSSNTAVEKKGRRNKNFKKF